MAALVSAVVVVGVIGILNLVFAFGIIRRLREHTEILNNQHGSPPKLILDTGEPADFEVTTVSGTPVTRASLTDPTLLGFFSVGCGPCETALPGFLAAARAHSGGRERVIAVVSAPDDGSVDTGAEELVTRLQDVAEVVRERPEEGLQAAFAVRGYPAFAVVESGVVRSNTLDTPALAAT